MPEPTLNVRILSPSKVLFDGPALSVSSKNIKGNFDILPEHANFITLVENHEIIVRRPQEPPLSFNLPMAIVYVSENQVSIYTYQQAT